MQHLDIWLKSIGRSKRTGRLWETSGRLEIVRIGARKYVTAEAAARFLKAEAERDRPPNPGWFGQKAAQ